MAMCAALPVNRQRHGRRLPSHPLPDSRLPIMEKVGEMANAQKDIDESPQQPILNPNERS
jgi:hypothetical protein